MIQYHDSSKIDSAGTYYNALGWAYAYGKDKSVKKYNNIRKIFAACGGASIYRKKVFEEIGMFDEKHFAYLEDIDVGYRARIAGYDNLYEPKSEVIHVGSAASGARYNEFKVKMSSRNNVYLIYKIHMAVKCVIHEIFLSQSSKIAPIKIAYLRYAVCGCCLCIKSANCYTCKSHWVTRAAGSPRLHLRHPRLPARAHWPARGWQRSWQSQRPPRPDGSLRPAPPCSW